MAAAAAAASAAPLAAALPAPSAPPPPIPDECTYKNRLQELTQRAYQKLPIYHTESKGEQHQLKFRSTVEVGSERFSSARCHSRIKDAEQDAARVAYEILVRIDDDDLTDVLGLIDQDVVFCKSILHEFTVKIKATPPTYSVDHPEGLGPMTLFVSSVLFAGNTYTGEAAKSKKDAEQKAARAAIKSILATNNTCMLQIIRSKKRLITAITSSGFNKERGAVSQENRNAPTNALPPVAPIQFVRAVGSSYPTADQGANIIPVADPTAQSVPPVATIQFVRAVGSSYATADQGANISPVADPTAQSVPPVGTIQFARAVGSSYPTADQGANIIPVADPSAQAVPGSKKRKKKRIRGSQVTEESVDEQHLTHRNMRFM